ncbi:uncharacterized protein LOC106067451 isoform X2 [Biomphalaria glabrata]|nr:uncharacterized protein LOC106067451 isoform X2 [Biomphalaria glabrata]
MADWDLDLYIDSASQQGREPGSTYFSYGGPATSDTLGSAKQHYGHSRIHKKDSMSAHSSCSDRGETEVSTIPARSRSFLDPNGLVMMTSHGPVDGYSHYAHTVTPFESILGEPLERFLNRRYSRSPYLRQPPTRLRNVVILMASLFIVALVAVIFTAVYFGQGFDFRSRL